MWIEELIGNGEIGPIAGRLQQLYLDAVHGRNDKYSGWLTPIQASSRRCGVRPCNHRLQPGGLNAGLHDYLVDTGYDRHGRACAGKCYKSGVLA